MRKTRSTGLAAMVALALSALAACTAPATTEAADSSTCAPTLPTGRFTVHLTVGGLDRLVLVYVPENVDRRDDRAALVLTLHGSTGDATGQLDRSRPETAADEHGFVVAAPQGAMPASPGTGGTS